MTTQPHLASTIHYYSSHPKANNTTTTTVITTGTQKTHDQSHSLTQTTKPHQHCWTSQLRKLRMTTSPTINPASSNDRWLTISLTLKPKHSPSPLPTRHSPAYHAIKHNPTNDRQDTYYACLKRLIQHDPRLINIYLLSQSTQLYDHNSQPPPPP